MTRTKKEQSQQLLQKTAFPRSNLEMQSRFPNYGHESILLKKGDISQENTQKNLRKTFILSLPHIQTNSHPIHHKMYCEMILF